MSIGSLTISPSTFSVKGSIFVHNGTSTAITSAGADGYYVTANSSASTGVSISQFSGADNNYFEKIATSTLTANASEISFTSIPGTYKDLMLIGASRNTSDDGANILIQFNTATAAANGKYRYVASRVETTTASVLNQTAQSDINFIGGNCVNSVTGFFGGYFMTIQSYSDSSVATGGYVKAFGLTTSSAGRHTIAGTYSYSGVEAITSIRIRPDAGGFATGTSFTLYGGK
jgi:hypothetical protein